MQYKSLRQVGVFPQNIVDLTFYILTLFGTINNVALPLALSS